MANNKIMVPQASEKLNKMKYEIAAEMGMGNYESMDKGSLTSRQNGQVGGEITKRLVKAGLENIQ